MEPTNTSEDFAEAIAFQVQLLNLNLQIARSSVDSEIEPHRQHAYESALAEMRILKSAR